MNKILTAGFVTLLGLLAFSLWQFPLGTFEKQAFGLLAFALVLEFSSVHLPTLGFVSASFPIFFLICFLPGCGPAIATIGIFLVLLLRTVLRSSRDFRVGAFEFLVDTLSIMSSVVVGGQLSHTGLLKVEGFPVGLVALLASLLCYWVLQTQLYSLALSQFEIPGELHQAQTEAMGLQVRASAMSAPALLLLTMQGPWHILWTLPVFLALYQSNWERLSELRKARAEKTVAKVESSRKDKVLLEAAKTMAALQSQKRLVQTCSASFAKTTTVKECFQALTTILRNLVPLDSVAVMVFRGKGLEPLLCTGPHTKQFFEQDRTGLREHLIGKSWSTGDIQRFNPSDTRPRIFEGENHAAAFPLHGQGILYIGSVSKPFSGEDFQRLSTVAYQFSLSLQSTHREEALATSLVEVKEANSQIQLGRERLLKLLEGSHKMTRKLDTNVIVEEACVCLQDIFQPDHLEIRVFQWGEKVVGDPPPQRLHEQVVSRLSEPETTYYLEELENASFTGHQLSWEGRVLGFIMMSSRVQNHFQIVQRRFLELLALHCSVMLTNSTLFSDVQQARKDLEQSQAQLVQSSKLAAVGQLAAGVAHELNTPLGAVLLSLQAANRQLKKARYEKVQDKLDDGVKGAQAAKDIVSKLLFYSREGREDVDEISLTTIVTDTVQFLGSQISDENIELTQNIQQECKVSGNQNELQQILTNFLVNARDAILATDRELGRINIEVQRQDGMACLIVTDNGTGFSDEVKKRAFEPFYTTKPVGQGTGLGLHVSRQIAERHGGSIEVASSSNGGAKVTLSLPCSKEGSPA